MDSKLTDAEIDRLLEHSQAINLNDNVRVKVRKRGMEIIRAERIRLRRDVPHMNWDNWREPDADGYLKEQLWVIANLFGSAFQNGSDPPIETTIDLCAARNSIRSLDEEVKRSRARIEAAPHASGCIHWRWVSASTNGDGGDGPHCNCWKSESNPEPITAPRTRNSEALNSFVAYCRAHPTWRFWQALRNWSSFGFILGADTRDGGTIDTFHMEGLDGCRDTPRVADEDSEALMPGGFND